MSLSTTMPATVTALPMGTQLSSSASASGTNGTLSENDFLQLLTAQLEDQDPLNPVSPSDFAAELAQFSTATGVQSLNSTMTANSGMQATSLVGQNVAVPGNALVLGQNGTANGAFSLSGAAKDVTVAIANSAGEVVQAIDLGPMAAGNQTFSWNGQSIGGTALASGTYSFNVNPTAAGSAAVTATSFSVVPVTSVVLGGQNGPQLTLGDGLAPVALSAVQQIY
jgi:flagellar basal-body rod modification protein FlgD